MLLANAIYFKGIWATPFKMEDTEDGIFHPSPSETIMVPTMHHLSYMKAAEDPYLSCKWVELPFDGKQFSMILMLPGNGLDTNTLAERMSSSNGLHSIFKNGRRRNVRLGLPKFKLSSEMKLGPALMKLGVQDVFSERDSDLRGISNMPLFVSHALHKSEISIDERGGSAASATAVVMKMRSAFAPAMDVMDVIFNRPFLVYIIDIVNKVPLFAGRVSDPSKT
ncbi:hypothetical protein ANN_06038 [Periplaneta americana]|uniref:Serpin domain-containing protein n=1 Tax=Periplaneta americana TaxID=6978 RepID=A0ABQ8TEB0_PERAM|nr:hypothetical protein ANN_06038 [Periplaneta americana]